METKEKSSKSFPRLKTMKESEGILFKINKVYNQKKNKSLCFHTEPVLYILQIISKYIMVTLLVLKLIAVIDFLRFNFIVG